MGAKLARDSGVAYADVIASKLCSHRVHRNARTHRFLPFSCFIEWLQIYPPGDLAFTGFGSMPGIGWSLGGLGISIGGSKGGPPLPVPALGTPLGVTGG